MYTALIWVVLAVPQGGTGFERCDLCHVSSDWHTMKSGASGFDHDPTGFPLRGSHAAASCSDCHNERPMKGSACVQCHTDPHRGEKSTTCDDCHGTYGWAIPQARIDHQRTRLPLIGRHASTPCADCHPSNVGDEWRAAPDDCAGCHRAEALAPGVHPPHTSGRFLTDCDACHTPYGWRPARVAHSRFWPLIGVHNVTPCDGCHVSGQYTGTTRDCFECHTDDFARGHRPTEPTNCVDCHIPTNWRTIINFDHSRFFPLPHGEGEVSNCLDCHPDSTDVFTCIACHEHRRGNTDGEHRGVAGYVYESNACFECHPRGVE